MGRATFVGGVAGAVVALDVGTKWLVQRSLNLGESVPVAGDLVRLTYVLNPGAAFGFSVGPHSRMIFGLLAVCAAVLILAVVRQTPPGEHPRLAALALILGGAFGNLVDRVRHAGGVVDFLDVGLGSFRWPIFNVADVGVTSGAVLLVLLLWSEEEWDAARRGESERARVSDDATRVAGR